MARNFDIVQRAYDSRWCAWAEVDDPDVDRDFYAKNGLPCPTKWIIVAVTHTREAAVRATKSVKI